MSPKQHRFVGLTHRVKRTAEGVARPTIVTILAGDKKPKTYKLETEDDEMDFLQGRYPVGYRAAVDGDDLTAYLERQLKRPKDAPPDSIEGVRVPIDFDGVKPGDTMALALGGSGGYLAHAMKRKADELGEGALVTRITPKLLSDARGTGQKDNDAELLATLARERPELFIPMRQVDLDQIELTIAWRDRIDAMRARIACEQRLYQRLIGRTFTGEGMAPERTLELTFLEAKATDKILKALVEEENERIREVERLLDALPVYREVFEPIEGCGPMIACRLLVAVGDILRFATAAKLKKFLGVAVTPEGKFWRRRSGEVANYHPDGRQALYLIGEQFNRRPETRWGRLLLQYKEQFRTKHPEEINPETGKKRYTKAHIHRMAT